MVSVILKRMSSFGKLSPGAYETTIAQLDNFPWSGLGNDAFSGNPGYSLDAKFSGESDPASDEEALDELLREEERNSPSGGEATE